MIESRNEAMRSRNLKALTVIECKGNVETVIDSYRISLHLLEERNYGDNL